jgi:hypothetical protein
VRIPPVMGKQDWTGAPRRQYWWIIVAVVVGSLIMMHGSGQQMKKGFSVFGQPGYLVPKPQVAALQQNAPYLRVFKSLGGLPLREAMTHPMGINRGSSFIEILYGSISGNYLDLVESTYALRTSSPATKEMVGTLAVREGVTTLGGKRRRFAFGKLGSGYFMLVGPLGGTQFAPALEEIAAKQ